MSTVVSMPIVSVIMVPTHFGVAGMMPNSRGIPGSFRRTTGISSGMGIVAFSVAVITMPSRVVGVLVGGVCVTGASIGIRVVVIGMMVVAGTVFITGNDGVCENQRRKN